MANSGYKDSILTSYGYTDVTFTASTTSDVFNGGAGTIVGILPDSDFLGSTLSFEWSYDGSIFYPSINALGVALSVSATAESFTVLSPADLVVFQYVKFVSDLTETATVKVVTRKVV